MEELCDHVITFWNSKNILRKWLLCASEKGPVAVPKPPVTGSIINQRVGGKSDL